MKIRKKSNLKMARLLTELIYKKKLIMHPDMYKSLMKSLLTTKRYKKFIKTLNNLW